MIFNLYIYNRKGLCIYYQDWNRVTQPESLEQEQALLFGFLRAINTFVEKTSPMEGDNLTSYTTSEYKLHYFETGTGFRFVLNTDPKAPNLQNDLRKLYSDIFVDYVVKNALYKVGDPINCSLFHNAVNVFITNHANYQSE